LIDVERTLNLHLHVIALAVKPDPHRTPR
jgi:hypothetical protein